MGFFVREHQDTDRVGALAHDGAAFDEPQAGVHLGIVDEEDLRVLGVLTQVDGTGKHERRKETGRQFLHFVEDGIIREAVVIQDQVVARPVIDVQFLADLTGLEDPVDHFGAVHFPEGMPLGFGQEDGKVLNSFVLDSVYELSYEEEERFENREGEIQYVGKTVKTGLFCYSVGGRCGLMDGNCHRLTGPLYSRISAVNHNMFRAILLDGWSEVILNAKGEVMR